MYISLVLSSLLPSTLALKPKSQSFILRVIGISPAAICVTYRGEVMKALHAVCNACTWIQSSFLRFVFYPDLTACQPYSVIDLISPPNSIITIFLSAPLELPYLLINKLILPFHLSIIFSIWPLQISLLSNITPTSLFLFHYIYLLYL